MTSTQLIVLDSAKNVENFPNKFLKYFVCVEFWSFAYLIRFLFCYHFIFLVCASEFLLLSYWISISVNLGCKYIFNKYSSSTHMFNSTTSEGFCVLSFEQYINNWFIKNFYIKSFVQYINNWFTKNSYIKSLSFVLTLFLRKTKTK